MEPPVNPDNKIILIVLLFAGILLGGLIVYAGMTALSSPGQGKSNTPEAVTQVNPVTTGPRNYVTTKSTTAAALSSDFPTGSCDYSCPYISGYAKSDFFPRYFRPASRNWYPGHTCLWRFVRDLLLHSHSRSR